MRSVMPQLCLAVCRAPSKIMSLGSGTKWSSVKRPLSSRIGYTFSVSSPVTHNVIIAASSSAACFGISGNYLVCY